MELFVFFALPLSTILLSIVLQKLLKSPILVAITFFAIYLIVAFVSFSDTLAEALIAVFIYSIIAYITAIIVKIIKCHNNREEQIANNTYLTNSISEAPTVTQVSNDGLNKNHLIDESFWPEENVQIERNNIKKRNCRRW